jgi:hypothetical protein
VVTVTRLVCLANSRKTGGRCVAGKEVSTGRWIRPIGMGPDQELSPTAYQYPDGSEPLLLDIFDLVLREARPGPHQPENWVLDRDRKWQRVGRLPLREIEPYIDHPVSLWTNTSSSSDGTNDQVPEPTRVDESLYLVAVEALVLDVQDSWRGRPKVRGGFQYAGSDYRLVVTDPVVEREYGSRPGQHDLGPAFLTVSLGEAYHGNCYKLIAGVILRSSSG